MGREAVTDAEIGREKGEVKVLLESNELILRGDIKRRFPRSELNIVSVDGESLMLKAGAETIALHLGQALATVWQKAILTPPPGLASKLGLKAGDLAFFVGPLDDMALAAVAADHRTDTLRNAHMVIAVVFVEADVRAAMDFIADHPALPLWLVYPKGKNATFGDSNIRNLMRSSGFMDTKACAVSDRLTATRYGLAKS